LRPEVGSDLLSRPEVGLETSSSKVRDDEHDDELDDDDDDDAAKDLKISSKDPRCPQIKVGVAKPTSGHQELHHEAPSQDIAPSRIWELQNKIPKATSGNPELVRDPRARREEQSTRSEHATTHMQRSARRNHAKSVVFLGLLSNT